MPNPRGGILLGFDEATDTTPTLLIAAPTGGRRLMIANIQICNTSAVDTVISIIEDVAGTPVVLTKIPAPGGGGALPPLAVPIPVTVAKSVGFVAADAATTISVGIQAYTAP